MLIRLDHGFEANRPADLRERRRLFVRLARNRLMVEAAQRLRERVFAEEIGARLRSDQPGVDWDRFDTTAPICLRSRLNEDGSLVPAEFFNSTLRRAWGGGHSEREFDLTPLANLRPHAAGIERTGVDQAWRGSATLALMWSA
jgi:putative hemolysin